MATTSPDHRPRRRPLRWVAVTTLLIAGALLLVLSIPAVFVRNQLLNTDRYVATMAPLARDPAVQSAIANRITNELSERLDLEARITTALAGLDRERIGDALSLLVGPTSDAVRNWVHGRVLEVVQSARFATAWDNANRLAHDQLTDVLTGKDSDLVQSDGETISVDLGAFLTVVADSLADRGLTLAASIPTFSLAYPVVTSDELPKIRSYVSLLDTTATWLPIIAVALLALAIFIGPTRQRGTLVAGLLTAIFAALFLAGISIARRQYHANLPDAVASPTAALEIFDTLLRNLRAATVVLTVLGVAVMVGAWIAGSSRLATAIRRQYDRGVISLTNTLHSWGVSSHNIGWVSTYRTWIMAGISALGVAVWLLWNPLRPMTFVVVGLATLATLAITDVSAKVAGRSETFGLAR